MSRIVSGQLRLLEKSSIQQAQNQGMSFHDGKTNAAPKSMEQSHPNLKRDASQRGNGMGVRGIVQGAEDLVKNSTYTVPFNHFSVGFEMVKEDAKNLNASRTLRRMGNRIIHPARMGKKDESGMTLPSRKQSLPPKKKSSIKKKETKKIHKIIAKAETLADTTIQNIAEDVIGN